jgi:hypothetical protein
MIHCMSLKSPCSDALERGKNHRHAGDFQAEHQGNEADRGQGNPVLAGVRERHRAAFERDAADSVETPLMMEMI